MDHSPVKPTRRYDLDWLRVFAILTVFIYHSTRFFNNEDWHVKNPTTYFAVDVWNSFATSWMMPLVFVISGASLFLAMGKGGFGQFVKDKLLRLGVPLAVGALTHASLQVYLDRLTHGLFQGSYFEFLPHYFEGVFMESGTPGNFAFHGMHLWYLLVLLLYSLALYPLLAWLRGPGQGVLRGLGNALAHPGAILLLALPLVLMDSLLGDTPLVDFILGGWGIGLYIPFLLAGFIIIANERLLESIRRMRWLSLAVGLAAMALYLLGGYGGIQLNASMGGEPLFEALDDPVAALSAWGLILAFLGFGRQHLNFTRPFLKYANEAVLPFYIFHQTVLLCVGFFVVRWAIPDPLKWLIIASLSFAAILVLYEYLVRRWNVMRFLFGMKLLPSTLTQQESKPMPARQQRST
jgi:peptidoglycan/LPS O-acetylase OafA/YrhL